MSELIELSHLDGIQISLAYATPDNFAKRVVYAKGAKPALRLQAYECLLKAIKAAQSCGLTIIVYDAYRPAAAQEIFWQAIADPRYVADASVGSNHTRGVAIDVSLIDESGNLLDMGTGFDAMCEKSHHNRNDLPTQVQRNRNLLLGIMLHAGFSAIPTEWWHYELPNSIQYGLIPESDFVQVIK